MPDFGSGIRHAVRRLARTPQFTLVALATLAVGIGANTAIFSVVNGVLLKPLPFEDSERLVSIWYKAPGIGPDEFPQGPAFHLLYRKENRVFEEVGLWRDTAVTVTGLAEPERLEALTVTEGLFEVIRVRPMLGRAFSQTDDSPQGPETVILSHAYWQRKFGGAHDVLGRKLTVDGRLKEIIGVMPRDFQFLSTRSELFLPYRLDRGEVFVGNFAHQSIARLKSGVTLAQASADVARMMPLVLKDFRLPPGFDLKMLEDVRLSPSLHPLKQDVVGDVGKVLWVLLGTVGMVLLIACANVANLFLVRAEGRQREFAVRHALGANRWVIAQELLIDSVILGLAGGVCGAFLAWAGVRFLVANGPANLPRLAEIALDLHVLAFTAGISLLAGVLLGLLPIVKYVRPDLVPALKEGGRSHGQGRERHRARNVLVVSQVALALVLLACSGLMFRTFQSMRAVQPGFTRPDEVLTLRISIPRGEVSDPEQSVRVHEEIMRRVEQLPGVTSVGLSSSITMDGLTNLDPIYVEDFPQQHSQIPPVRRYKYVSENYFATMGNPVLFGRAITTADIHGKANVLVISENLAREYWKDPARAVGRRIKEGPKAPWREIVGVVGNERDDGVSRKPPAIVYWPMLVNDYWGNGPFAQRSMSYAIRSDRAANSAFLKELQQTVWSVRPTLPLSSVRLLSGILGESMAQTSFTLVMLGLAAAVALLLGVVGIYGVISYSVSRRTREIGVRTALGAQRHEVRGMFVREGLTLAGIGLAAGLLAAGGLTRLMSALLFGVDPLDPATFAAVSALLALVAMAASYLPARRASSVDPVEALRWE